MENPKLTQSITRSYSRTVQVSQYEPASSFMSLSFQWYDAVPSNEEVVAKSSELFETCKKMVESEIESLTARKNKDIPF